MKEEKLSCICADAQETKLTRGKAILCGSGNGTTPSTPIPLLSDGSVCVATTIYSTGHLNPDVSIDRNKMYDCPYRNPGQ